MVAPETSAEMHALLQALVQDECAIIVEGKKDRAALETLGVPGSQIVELDRRPLFEIAEEVAAEWTTVAILTDLDIEGKKMYGTLNSSLQRLGMRIDNTLRNFLFKKTSIRQIEGIATL